jgi:hypothetical protein
MSGADVQTKELDPGEASPDPTADEVGPLRDLVAIAADLVEMVEGRAGLVSVSSSGLVTVHVTCQVDAEQLAWRLGLDTVTEYPSRDEGPGFTVWSGGCSPAPRFAVLCDAVIRPVRAFPRPTDGGRVA